MKQLYYKNIYYLYYTPTPWRSVTRRAPSRGWSRMHSESDSTMLIHSDQTHTNSQSHQTRAQSAEQSRNGYIPKRAQSGHENGAKLAGLCSAL